MKEKKLAIRNLRFIVVTPNVEIHRRCAALSRSVRWNELLGTIFIASEIVAPGEVFNVDDIDAVRSEPENQWSVNKDRHVELGDL